MNGNHDQYQLTDAIVMNGQYQLTDAIVMNAYHGQYQLTDAIVRQRRLPERELGNLKVFIGPKL
jgi:hypothetical protein